MGIICCKYEDLKESHTLTHIPAGVINAEQEIIDLENPAKFIELIGRNNIEAYFSTTEEMIKRQGSLKAKANEIVNDKVGVFENPFSLFLVIEKLEGEEYPIHNYYSENKVKLTPEIFFIHQLQMDKEQMKIVDSGVEDFEISNIAIDPEFIIWIQRTMLEKTIFVDQRNFMVLRGVKKNRNGDFIEFQRNLEYTPLANHKVFQELIAQTKNLVQIHEAGSVYSQNHEGSFNVQGYSRMNILSGVGKIILKPFVAKKSKSMQASMSIELIKFVLNTNEYTKLSWFTWKQNELEKIFQENFEILKKSNIDLKKLDSLSVSSFTSKLSHEKQKLLLNEEISDVLLSKVDTSKIEPVKEIKDQKVEENKEIIQEKKSGLSRDLQTEQRKLSQQSKGGIEIKLEDPKSNLSEKSRKNSQQELNNQVNAKEEAESLNKKIESTMIDSQIDNTLTNINTDLSVKKNSLLEESKVEVLPIHITDQKDNEEKLLKVDSQNLQEELTANIEGEFKEIQQEANDETSNQINKVEQVIKEDLAKAEETIIPSDEANNKDDEKKQSTIGKKKKNNKGKK